MNKMLLGVLFTVITLSALVEKVQPYAFGAPAGTCFTMYPHHHGHPKQETEMPYTIQFLKQYSDGDTITIDVSTNDTDRPIRGIMIGARRATMNTEEFVGQFTSFPENKIKALSCFHGFHNMITHHNNKPVKQIRVQWKAPSQHVGDVIFWVSLVENFETFWVAENFTLRTDKPDKPVVNSTYPEIPMAQLVTETNFSSCGDTKGCFFYPAHCDGHNCIAAVSYQYRPATQDYLFEMFTKDGPNYLSLGFSSDKTMGDDFTVSCVANSVKLSVQQGMNPGYHNELQFTRSITEREIMQKDGNIHCRFGLSVKAESYHINQKAESYDSQDHIFDLNNSWYLLAAWGSASEGSDVIEYHDKMPAISFSKINLKDTSTSSGSVLHIMIRVHASLMVIAWVLFTGLVTVIARHYTDWFPKRRLFGTKVWFQVHRALAILVATLTIIGIIIIFAHFGRELREPAGNHAKVGLAVLACVCVQLIAGFLRPGPDSSVRPFFKWGHRLLGHTTHILSATTMILAFDIKYLTSDLRNVGLITLGVWVGGQILWHIIFDIYSFCHLRSKETFTNIDMSTSAAVESKEKGRNAVIDNALISLYIVCLLAFTSAIMIFVLFY